MPGLQLSGPRVPVCCLRVQRPAPSFSFSRPKIQLSYNASSLFGLRLASPCTSLTLPVTSRPGLLIVAKAPLPGRTSIAQKQKRKRINKNGKLERYKMHVRSGDVVVVITGKDKGKVSTVEKVNTTEGMIIVKDVNMSTRYMKPQNKDEKGQIIQKEAYIHSSNVMHWSSTEQVRSRIGRKIVDGKKVRYLKKTGEIVPEPPYERKAKKSEKKDDQSSSE
eukprot:TRINITY_DN2766_c0_g1_i1.p1 TRINITY_DN2766_c0_g1~~TRINITY_DN2766_c0_g1_i1.p1  ORF type:complete len:220 (+),score=7.52 TRINITY_DN2766_c0_g1_i1:53-712(+)